MQAILPYAIEAIVTTGVLCLLYRLIIDRKVPFGWARTYLIAALLVGAVIPALEIPVWRGEVVYLEPTETPPTAVSTAIAATDNRPIFPIEVWLYGAGVVCCAGLFLRQCWLIARIRRHATLTRASGHSLARTELRITPFSFLRTIYVWRQTPDEELPAILAHEASHIRRGHTAERIGVELFKVLFWWNPFVWLIARTLTEVEEFEADRDVLCGGFSRDEYMTTLFRQLFGLRPDLANGLPHSFTKKRFKMMTKQIQSSHKLLRTTAVAVVVAGLVCAFSLTAQATQYRTSEPNRSAQEQTPQINEIVVAGYGTPSSEKGQTEPAGDDEPFLIVEQMPTFEGGDINAFRRWVMERIRPCKDDAGELLTGRVVVQFTIERDGSLTIGRVMQTPDTRLSNEVIRLLAASPKWEAGMQRGHKVRVIFTMPVEFSAQ